ncbi:MAG: hypothetical protein EXR72_18865 [Myxococcales bacterium]|nr:hypothetical protein [Myxococcales bacterium]
MLAAGLLRGAQLSTTAFSANTQFVIPVYGYTAARVRVSLATVGTVMVMMDGATSAPAGYLNTNVEGQKATYSAAQDGFTTAVGNPTDIVILTLPAGTGKVVRVLRVAVNGTAPSAVGIPVQLVKRTTLNTGGTLNGPLSIASHDSADAAPAAVADTYSANPTTGTGAVVRAQKLAMPTVPGSSIVWDFGSGRHGRALVLRPGQQMALKRECRGVSIDRSA